MIGSLRRVSAVRYVLPLREGGSLPGLVEADDLGIYVTKFRGAGQGRPALVAEVVVGELARALGLPVPDQVLVDLDPQLAPAEPDQEVQDLLRASAGTNLGIDYLPGSLGFDATADRVDPDLAARILWFDALVDNVDRTWRNPNLLVWHRRLYLIDHGAALWWQHNLSSRAAAVARPLRTGTEHVLLRQAGPLDTADEQLAGLVTRETLEAVTALVPDGWLADEPDAAVTGAASDMGSYWQSTAATPNDRLTAPGPEPSEARAAFVDHLLARTAARTEWLGPLEVARAASV